LVKRAERGIFPQAMGQEMSVLDDTLCIGVTGCGFGRFSVFFLYQAPLALQHDAGRPSVLSLACHTIRVFLSSQNGFESGRRGLSEVKSLDSGTQHTRDVPWHDMVDILAMRNERRGGVRITVTRSLSPCPCCTLGGRSRGEAGRGTIQLLHISTYLHTYLNIIMYY